MQKHLSDILSFENGDIRAEYIYQRIFGFHDVLATCLAAIGEVFSMRHALTEKSVRNVETFLQECHKASYCTILTESRDRVEVSLHCITLSYECKKKCLSIGPTKMVRKRVEEGHSHKAVNLQTQNYWVTPVFFPPLSVFRAIDRECLSFLQDYDTLLAWQNTAECAEKERLARDVFAEVKRISSFWPDSWDETLVFGFPDKESIRFSFAARVEDATGRNGTSVPLQQWKESLHPLLLGKLDAGKRQVLMELSHLISSRDAFRKRTNLMASLSETEAIPVQVDTGSDAEKYYVGMMLKSARNRQPEFQIETFLRNFQFFVRGRKTSVRLLLDAEKNIYAPCDVHDDEMNRPYSISFHFPLFEAEYDLRCDQLTLTLDRERFAEYPTQDMVMHFDKVSPSSHFSIRVLSDSHYALQNALRSVKEAKDRIAGDTATFSLQTACLRSVLSRIGGLLVPFGEEPPLFRLSLQPMKDDSFSFILNPMTPEGKSVSVSLPLASHETALVVWWSRWTMKRLMDDKKAEKELNARIAAYENTASRIIR